MPAANVRRWGVGSPEPSPTASLVAADRPRYALPDETSPGHCHGFCRRFAVYVLAGCGWRRRATAGHRRPARAGLPRAGHAARARLTRRGSRPLLVCQAGGTAGIRRWLESSGLPLGGVTYLDVRIATIFPSLPHEIAPGLEVISGHTDRWVLVDSPDTDTARAWVKGLLAPGEERADRPAAVPCPDRLTAPP